MTTAVSRLVSSGSDKVALRSIILLGLKRVTAELREAPNPTLQYHCGLERAS
jgi:hypothetical protein